MRLPFSKTADPRPELAFPSLTDAAGSFDLATPSESDPISSFAAAPSPNPEIGSALSPNARNSALQLVGTIREILVGDQIRTLDTRFANLHNSIEGNVTGYIADITGSIEAMQSALHAEITETRGTLAENAARFEHRSEAANDAIAQGAERTAALESSVEAHVEDLRREDLRIARNLESTAMRLTSLEANLNHSLAQLEGEDAIIAGALEDSVARTAEVEKSLAGSIDHLQQIERRQVAAQEDALNNAARIVSLEETLNAIAETLHRKNFDLENQVNDAIARVSVFEGNINTRIEEIYDHLSSATATVGENANRIATLDEKAEALRLGFNQKMNELCSYVTAQVERAGRQAAPPAARPQAPAAATAPAQPASRPAPTPAPARPDIRPAAGFSPPVVTRPVATAPAPATPSSNEFPSFPKFPTFPTFPSHESPQPYPQPHRRA